MEQLWLPNLAPTVGVKACEQNGIALSSGWGSATALDTFFLFIVGSAINSSHC